MLTLIQQRKDGYLLLVTLSSKINSVVDQATRRQTHTNEGSVWGQLEFFYDFGMAVLRHVAVFRMFISLE